MSLPLRAYPAQMIESHAVTGGAWVTLRPVRPEDEAMLAGLLAELSPVSRYQRHFAYGAGPDLALLERLRGSDYDHILGLVAVTVEDGAEVAVGLAEYAASDGAAEFALVVADRWQRRGLGSRLLAALLRGAQAAGLKEFFGYALAVNDDVLRLTRRQGFVATPTPDATVMRVTRRLDADGTSAAVRRAADPACIGTARTA